MKSNLSHFFFGRCSIHTTHMTKKHPIWNKCENVPCGKVMDNCRPEYCIDVKTNNMANSKNWGNCNMEYISPKKYKGRYTRKCNDERRSRPSKTRMMKTTRKPFSVDAEELHSKMPYIWRHLDGKTRKRMITLAKKPMSWLNK